MLALGVVAASAGAFDAASVPSLVAAHSASASAARQSPALVATAALLSGECPMPTVVAALPLALVAAVLLAAQCSVVLVVSGTLPSGVALADRSFAALVGALVG